MSDTQTQTTASVHVLHPTPTPAPQPLPALTGAPAAVHAELATRPHGATTAELSLAAGLGRSTTGKALTLLEEAGLAARKRGGHSGTGRTPDRWHSTPQRPTNQRPRIPHPRTRAPDWTPYRPRAPLTRPTPRVPWRFRARKRSSTPTRTGR